MLVIVRRLHCFQRFQASSWDGFFIPFQFKSVDFHRRKKDIMKKDRGRKLYGNHVRTRACDSDGESCESNDVIDEHAFDEEKAYKALKWFLCNASVPPCSVKEESFKHYVKSVNPCFNVEYDTVIHQCLDFHKEEKVKLKEILRSFDGRISLSVDIMRHDKYGVCDQDSNLPDSQTNLDYLCVKAHFIGEDWKLKSYILGFSPTLDGTPENLPENVILKFLSDLEIEDKVFTLTSATAIVNLYENAVIVRNKLQETRRIPLDGRLFHLGCCADILRSVVAEAFQKIEYIIRKVRQMVFWGNSSLLWNMTLHKLQEALELEAKGQYSETDYCKGRDIPSAEEWKKVRDVCKLVQNVYDVAEVLFETKHASAGIYVHNFQELQASLLKESRNSDKFVRIMAQRMLKKFEKYWKNMFLVLAFVTVLDPRYKMKYIEFSSLKYDTSSGISEVTAISESIHRLYDDYVTHKIKEEYTMSDSNSEFEEELPANIKERRLRPDFGFNCLDEYNQFIESDSRSQPTKSELECYLEEPVVPWSKNFGVLSWWQSASPKYPTLSKMARDLLPIQFSLVTGLDAFYTELREPDQKLVFLDILNADEA